MIWAPFLHFYQPPTQFRQVLEKITKESYAKIVEILAKNPKAKLTLNISASLTEQLGKFAPQIIAKLKKLAQTNQIEFTGSAAYHPLLPKLPKQEIVRQIKLNSEINKKYFGKVFAPRGFFPPEMAYSDQVGNVLEELGFTWVILEDVSCPISPAGARLFYPEKFFARVQIFKRREHELKIFFRDHDLSLKIAYAAINSIAKLEEYLACQLDAPGYLVTAVDGETFGHHQKGQELFLKDLFQFAKLPSVKISELFRQFTEIEEVEPVLSTWGISEADCRKGNIYPRWDLPQNPLHKLQWRLTDLAINSCKNQKKGAARNLLDKALHSDQYWWASHNPYWHYKMVLLGTNMLKDVVLSSGASKKDKFEAKNLRDKIANLGLVLYGDTVIDR